jgi:SAM-dependent methyltransferase
MNQKNNIKKTRFQYLKWNLNLFRNSLELRKNSFPLDCNTKDSKYPIRVLRYWWVISAIEDELKYIKSPVIADIGCDKAILKRLLPTIPGAKIIGMDLAEQLENNMKYIELAKYDKLIPCNLDVGIPLPDSSVDILVNLHVLEHLPRPKFAIAEFARILRPGGLLLLGFPVLPKFLSKIRQKKYDKQFANGTRVLGQHQHAFWPSKARLLVEKENLKIDFILGTYFIRKMGAFWENSAMWMRINQIWGSLFPSLGQELCIKAHKPK